jgi:hypothetical protein
MPRVVKAVALSATLALVLGAGRAHACDEVSDVTGYRRCTSFGFGWDVSPAGSERALARRDRRLHLRSIPLFVEAAAVMQTVDVGATTFSDTTADSRPFTLHDPSLGAAAVYGVDLRAGLRVAGPFYAGVTTRVAFGALPAHATAVADGVRVDLGGGFGVASIGGLLGFAKPLSRQVRLRLEATVGFEDVGLLAVGGIACSENPCGPDSPRAFLEPHVVVDLWLGPSWSVSPFAGDDVLHPGSVALGVMASWHWKGFDGQR